jgi:hypothetical protein
MRWIRTLGVVVVALTSVGCYAQPPAPGTPEAVLRDLTAGTRFANVAPKIVVHPTVDSMSVAFCGNGIGVVG